jgi:hypothetical protein
MKLRSYGNVILVLPNGLEPEAVEFALDDAEAREEAKPCVVFAEMEEDRKGLITVDLRVDSAAFDRVIAKRKNDIAQAKANDDFTRAARAARARAAGSAAGSAAGRGIDSSFIQGLEGKT